ncbi:SH3 domain-containing protein [Pseudooceanicola sp.]|uniref:SH3 domain-containing protein n=1 Tax=Pseudooceanicola sp. TaxID=1914328 RepID=UPI002610C58E|nr:SH3 domain-containing protein [Pseudooceanicola sp.]MDF1856672.1 SH3 domain-containing protein [Pseudooceanicola sp.]
MIRRRRLALLVALAASPVAATEDQFPALYDVQHVASIDVLNLREYPNASAPVIAALAPDAHDIEVVEAGPNGRWGRVNINGVSGWASLRYLRRHPDAGISRVPDIARCGGTEPFWGLRRSGTGYVFDAPEIDETRFTRDWRGTALGRSDRFAMTLHSQRASIGEGVAVIARASCSDGMSGYLFGLTIDLFLNGTSGETLYSGCCSLQP